ncbi:MAG: DUF1801 domain-containing protein [Calditrichaeota bacterium]|nr:MAG: DUF1801 domain-containing protein [Calditrichota bacterium]MBL1206220.1 DUF1801 domain-containing protein [Calditrichota bacterium]NOG46046.1 DUF1801 domain-containing protein [Calditrichota bacterium]
MKSNATNVDQYLQEVPEKRVQAITKLRALCKEILVGYEESMIWKMPSYKKDQDVEVAFASQKQHICVYILKHEVMLNNKELLKGLNHGKGCIRFSNPDKIDYDVITKLLKESTKSEAGIC